MCPPTFRGGGDVNNNRPPPEFPYSGGTWEGHVSKWGLQIVLSVVNNDVPIEKYNTCADQKKFRIYFISNRPLSLGLQLNFYSLHAYK